MKPPFNNRLPVQANAIPGYGDPRVRNNGTVTYPDAPRTVQGSTGMMYRDRFGNGLTAAQNGALMDRSRKAGIIGRSIALQDPQPQTMPGATQPNG